MHLNNYNTAEHEFIESDNAVFVLVKFTNPIYMVSPKFNLLSLLTWRSSVPNK